MSNSDALYLGGNVGAANIQPPKKKSKNKKKKKHHADDESVPGAASTDATATVIDIDPDATQRRHALRWMQLQRPLT